MNKCQLEAKTNLREPQQEQHYLGTSNLISFFDKVTRVLQKSDATNHGCTNCYKGYLQPNFNKLKRIATYLS